MKTPTIKLFLFLISAIFGFNSIIAQDLDLYKSDMFISKKDTLPYRILLPKNYNPNVQYPLILFLHGAGERGNDNRLQLTHGADLFLREDIRRQYPAVVVFPQCAANETWGNYGYSRVNDVVDITYSASVDKIKHQNLLKGLIKRLKKEFSLDNNRLYVGGLSMGGMGTFDAVNQNPRLFAAAFAICGGANPKIAKRISKTSWWIFHGAEDDIVPAKYSQNMYDALKDVNADIKLTIYPNAKHDSWTNTFAEPELLKWLFSKSL